MPYIRGRFTRETLTFQAFLCVLGMMLTPFQENTIIFRTDVEQCTNFERFLADSKEKHMFFAKKSYTADSLCGKRDVFLKIALFRGINAQKLINCISQFFWYA